VPVHEDHGRDPGARKLNVSSPDGRLSTAVDAEKIRMQYYVHQGQKQLEKIRRALMLNTPRFKALQTILVSRNT
jgi:hypothetical protein